MRIKGSRVDKGIKPKAPQILPCLFYLKVCFVIMSVRLFFIISNKYYQLSKFLLLMQHNIDISLFLFHLDGIEFDLAACEFAFDSFAFEIGMVEFDATVNGFVFGICVIGLEIFEFELDLFEFDPKKV